MEQFKQLRQAIVMLPIAICADKCVSTSKRKKMQMDK